MGVLSARTYRQVTASCFFAKKRVGFAHGESTSEPLYTVGLHRESPMLPKAQLLWPEQRPSRVLLPLGDDTRCWRQAIGMRPSDSRRIAAALVLAKRASALL